MSDKSRVKEREDPLVDRPESGESLRYAEGAFEGARAPFAFEDIMLGLFGKKPFDEGFRRRPASARTNGVPRTPSARR